MTEPFTWHHLNPLLNGLLLTLQLCLLSAIGGSILGLGIGIGQTVRFWPVRWLCVAYVNVVRGIPMLVLIFMAYFGIPLLFPSISLEGFATAFVALTLWAAAFMAEVFRGSIQAIPRGQTEAAMALGLKPTSTFRYVIYPQMMKIAFPAGLGFMLILIKESSLISVIGYVELTKAGGIVSNLTGNPLLTYLCVGLFYFVVCYGVARFGRWYEARADRRTVAPIGIDVSVAQVMEESRERYSAER